MDTNPKKNGCNLFSPLNLLRCNCCAALAVLLDLLGTDRMMFLPPQLLPIDRAYLRGLFDNPS